MFTGIVSEVGHILSIQPGKLVISASLVLKDVKLGDSIAVNGTCLTVTGFTPDSFSVDIAPETVRRTNLGSLKSGDPVNLERALGFGGELGGHLVQGHVDGTGKISDIRPEGGATIYRIEAPPQIMRYLVEKGFVAVEGISLTITERGDNYFQVSVVDFTRKHTNLNTHKVGDIVNLEIDILAKYIERYLQSQKPTLTENFLRENGF